MKVAHARTFGPISIGLEMAVTRATDGRRNDRPRFRLTPMFVLHILWKCSDNVFDMPLGVQHMYDQYHEDHTEQGDALSQQEPSKTTEHREKLRRKMRSTKMHK
ncbi:hypothetical protein QZH41_013069 [Actinostola sp. cb2023]|nr:hypothetical protein QZH41_013069 [Actinostola sp. cb2023]